MTQLQYNVMYPFVGQLVRHLSERITSTTIGWIAMTFGTDIQGFQRMSHKQVKISNCTRLYSKTKYLYKKKP